MDNCSKKWQERQTNGREKFILSALINNGLILDRDENYVTSIIREYGCAYLNQYFLRYAIMNENNELIFVPGTVYSRIENDILFDKELKSIVIKEFSLFKVLLQQSIMQIQKKSRDEAFLSFFPDLSLEDILFDYSYSFSNEDKVALSSFWKMDEKSFFSSLNLIAYSYERAREGRKLIDHVFKDKLSNDKYVSNNMIGPIIEENARLLRLKGERSLAMNHISSLMKRYSIKEERIGLEKNVNLYN